MRDHFQRLGITAAAFAAIAGFAVTLGCCADRLATT